MGELTNSTGASGSRRRALRPSSREGPGTRAGPGTNDGLMIVAGSDWKGRLGGGKDVLVCKGGIDQIHRPVSHRFEDRQDGLLGQAFLRSIARIPSALTRGKSHSAIRFNPTVKAPELQKNAWHSQKAVAVMCLARHIGRTAVECRSLRRIRQVGRVGDALFLFEDSGRNPKRWCRPVHRYVHKTPIGIPGVRRLLVHVEHDRRLHLIEDVSNGQAFRYGVRLRRSPRILRESRGMITIDIVTDAGDGERVATMCEEASEGTSKPYGSGIDIVSPR